MARPAKFTVDYFSHDSNASVGRTLSILFNNFGHDGISAWWQLLEKLASTNNHTIAIRNSEDLEYLASRLHFKPERLKEILDKLASLEAIDRELYLSGTIWSQNFVDRLEPVYKSRGQPLPSKPTIVLTDNSISSAINNIDLPDNTQTKGTILNHTKQEVIKGTPYGDSNIAESQHKNEGCPKGSVIKEVTMGALAGKDEGVSAKGLRRRPPPDPRVAGIFNMVKEYYRTTHPDLTIDPIPNYPGEGSHIKKMLARGFLVEDIFECWRNKSESRNGYCSMSYVNADIEQWINNGKSVKSNGNGHNEHPNSPPTSEELAYSWGRPQ